MTAAHQMSLLQQNKVNKSVIHECYCCVQKNMFYSIIYCRYRHKSGAYIADTDTKVLPLPSVYKAQAISLSFQFVGVCFNEVRLFTFKHVTYSCAGLPIKKSNSSIGSDMQYVLYKYYVLMVLNDG